MDDRTQAMNFIPSLSIQPTQQPPQNNERDIFVEHVSLQPLKKNVGMLVQFEANRIKMEFQILPGAAIPLLGDTLRRTFSCHQKLTATQHRPQFLARTVATLRRENEPKTRSIVVTCALFQRLAFTFR
jgi:hypothetical protein